MLCCRSSCLKALQVTCDETRQFSGFSRVSANGQSIGEDKFWWAECCRPTQLGGKQAWVSNKCTYPNICSAAKDPYRKWQGFRGGAAGRWS